MRMLVDSELPCRADSPRSARRMVREALRGSPAEVVHDSELVVSELVTNAVRHCGQATHLQLRVLRPASATIRIEVRDGFDGVPRQQPAQVDDLGGRGLILVDAVADRWGVTRAAGGGKTVWCELS